LALAQVLLPAGVSNTAAAGVVITRTYIGAAMKGGMLQVQTSAQRDAMTMVPEGRRVFPRTSVMDNLLLGAYSRKDKENVKGDLNKIFEMFPRLLERKNQLAGTLSGG
jgi:branched-chain amino acid transport system ATP-binding protein